MTTHLCIKSSAMPMVRDHTEQMIAFKVHLPRGEKASQHCMHRKRLQTPMHLCIKSVDMQLSTE